MTEDRYVNRDDLAELEMADDAALSDDTVEFTMRLSRSLVEKVQARAATVGFTSKQKYIRALLHRELDRDPDDEFLDQLLEWWASRGRGDPGQIRGAIWRAQGAGMTFAWKLRTALKTMFDQGLI